MKKRAWLAWILIASMLLTLWPASVAYALERPVIYAEMNDGRQSEYMGEYSRTRVYDNGEKKKVDVMTIPVDEVQALVWHPVDGAAYYLYSIRDVENDEVIVFNQRLSNYWVSLNDLLWAETLQYDVTYKMAVAACQSEDDCFWSEPFYFTLTETLGGDDSSDSEDDDPFEYEDDPIIEPDDNPRPQINEHSSTPEPTELAGWFYQESVSLKVGERIQVGGRVEVSGSTLSRVTYQIDGWSGDDASNRYCTQEVSDVTAVELSNLSALVLDASSAPLNVPGTYTLRLVASAADGTWNHLAMMTVVVESAPTQEPVITTEPTQEPESRPVLERPVVYAELDADRSAYAGASERAALSDNGARLETDVMIVPVDEASHLVWHPVDGAEYYLYSIRDVDNDVAVVSNWQLSEYWVTLPDLLNNGTLRYGVNYKIAAAACASAEDCYWSAAPFYFRLVETLCGDTTAPVTQEPDITTAPTEDTSSVPTPTPATEAPVITPAPVPEVRLSASIMDEYVEIELGKTARVEGWVACEGALLERVTFLIKDHPVPGDPNNRFCSHEVGNENTIDLYDLDDMVLDTNRAPLNEPGNYTVELYAKAVGAEHGEKLKEIQVRVYAAEKPEDTSATGKTDTPPENESKQPQNPEDLSNIEVDGTFGRKSVKLKLGESTRVSGSVSCAGDTIARVTYLIAGHKIGDDGNNRYCTQELSGVNYADLEDMSDLLLDTNRAPLNVPGSYTLELWVKSAKGEARCVSTMTVEVEGEEEKTAQAHSEDDERMSEEYKASIFYRNLKQVNLTGDLAQDIVAVARSQVGYLESDRIDGTGKENKENKVEYNHFYGQSGRAWCAYFVCWCSGRAQVPNSVIKLDGRAMPFWLCPDAQEIALFWSKEDIISKTSEDIGIDNMKNYLSNKNVTIYENRADFVPQAGDLIFFHSSNKKSLWGHVGIVTGCYGNTVYFIDGNNSGNGTPKDGTSNVLGKVYERKVEYTNPGSNVIGFARPNYAQKMEK